MASEHTATLFQTPGPSRKRHLSTPGSVQDFRSHKKRRMSMAAADISADVLLGERTPLLDSVATIASPSSLQRDRFISARPESIIPLAITPRTKRMYQTFGMLGPSRLSFRDENQSPTGSSSSTLPSKAGAKDNGVYELLLQSASSLVKKTKHTNPSSVTQNLALSPRSFMALDSPCLSESVYSCPISWSTHNLIAVACGPEVYYQNLDTRKVSRFFRTGDASAPVRRAIAKEVTHIGWGQQAHATKIASASDTSFLEVYDAGAGGCTSGVVLALDQNMGHPPGSMGCLSWYENQLAWADHNELFTLDVREGRNAKRNLYGEASTSHHGSSIVSMAWNGQGTQVATGDLDGVVHIWDVRARKMLTERGKLGKMKHGGPVKSLAWCPWRQELLATGTVYPEGTIRTWNVSELSKSTKLDPENVIQLKTAVTSLVWSPECKELLSVHGISFEEPMPIKRRTRSLGLSMGSHLPGLSSRGSVRQSKRQPPKIIQTAFTNSLLVHDYPSCKRLLTLTGAHRHSITAACLGPNGQDVFTASPKDEAIKCWRVWAKGASLLKDTPFSRKNIIR